MIDLKDIYPGFYYAKWERIEESRLIVIVQGKSPGYVFDVMEHLGEGEGRYIPDVKLHKKPIIFFERLTQLDREE